MPRPTDYPTPRLTIITAPNFHARIGDKFIDPWQHGEVYELFAVQHGDLMFRRGSGYVPVSPLYAHQWRPNPRR